MQVEPGPPPIEGGEATPNLRNVQAITHFPDQGRGFVHTAQSIDAAPSTGRYPPLRNVRGNERPVLSDRRISTHCDHSKIYVLDSEFR
jgi:hypothetical protein